MTLRPLVRRSRPLAAALLGVLAACRATTGPEATPIPEELLGRYLLVMTEAPGREPYAFHPTSGHIELGPRNRATRVVTYPAIGDRAGGTFTDTGRVALTREGRVSLRLVTTDSPEPVGCCLLMEVEHTPGQLVLRLPHPADGEIIETYRRPATR